VSICNGGTGFCPKKDLRASPDKNIGILPHRLGHGDILEGVISLQKNNNVLVLKLIEMGAAQFGHDMFFLGAIRRLATDQHRFIRIHIEKVQCVPSVICVSSVSIRGGFSLARAGRDLTVR
jgi:hypothetical protein